MATAIFQADTYEYRFTELNAGEKAPFSQYLFVGIVESDNPEEVYHMTNLWDKPESVHTARGQNMRSSSVGDIFVMSDGRTLQVKRCGFGDVEWDYNK